MGILRARLTANERATSITWVPSAFIVAGKITPSGLVVCGVTIFSVRVIGAWTLIRSAIWCSLMPNPERADRYLATICRACGHDRHDGTACKPEPQVAQSKGKLNFPRMLRFLWPMRHSR